MAQAISGSLRNISARQLLFPQFRQRKSRSKDEPFVTSNSRERLGNEIVRGKGYLLLAARRSHSSDHVSVNPNQRPKSQGSSRVQGAQGHVPSSKMMYVPIIACPSLGVKGKRQERGFELMKRLSRIRRRKVTEFEWSPEATSFCSAAPVRPKKLQISLVLPTGSCPSEESEEVSIDTYKKKQPHARAASSFVGSAGDAMRRRIDAIAVDDSPPLVSAEKPLIHFSPAKGEKADADLRTSLYKARRTPRC